MNKNTGIRIVASGRALPSKNYSNDALKAYMDTDDEWIYKRTGIKSRGFCNPKEEDQLSLAIDAAGKAIAKAKFKLQDFNVNDIGAVLVTSCSAVYRLPSTACMVQKALGLPQSVLAYDLNAACSGFIYAIMTARGLMLSEDYKYCLIVASEQLSAETDLHDRSTGILFADGAGAVIVKLDNGDDAAAYTSAAWSDGDDEVLCCGIEPGGTLAGEADKPGNTEQAEISQAETPPASEASKLSEDHTELSAIEHEAATQDDSAVADYKQANSILRARKPVIEMNGHEVFRFASNAVPQTIDELLKKSGLEFNDIDFVLCHQANARILDFVKRKYKGHEDKFLMNIENHGNTSSASIPVLLDEMLERGVIKAGNRIICVGFGAGLTWGGVIVNV